MEIRFSALGIVFPESVKSRRDQKRTLGLQNVQPDSEMQQKNDKSLFYKKTREKPHLSLLKSGSIIGVGYDTLYFHLGRFHTDNRDWHIGQFFCDVKKAGPVVPRLLLLTQKEMEPIIKGQGEGIEVRWKVSFRSGASYFVILTGVLDQRENSSLT
ncbi:MAG: hypothetical protein WC096_03160 [Sphaerochaetaceae bacterium]